MHEPAYANLPRNPTSTHKSKSNLNNLARFLTSQTINLSYAEKYQRRKIGIKNK